MAEYIEREALIEFADAVANEHWRHRVLDMNGLRYLAKQLPAANVYTAHEVAEILADLTGETCACNFNDNDEWLPEWCELLDACPNTVGVACWEQYLKHLERRSEDG